MESNPVKYKYVFLRKNPGSATVYYCVNLIFKVVYAPNAVIHLFTCFID